MIGYACVPEKNTLSNFYITPKHSLHGKVVLEEFIKQREIKKAEVTTNNPICLSLIMHFQKSIEIDSYLFKDMEEVIQEERDVEFRQAEPDDLESLVNIQVASEIFEGEEASKDWLKDYFDDLISRAAVFVLEKKNKIIGFLEARTSNLKTKTTSLGVVVLPEYRKQGYGSYLICKGKTISRSIHSEPICSCNIKNIGSRKTIEKSGFRILHLSLLVNL